MELSISHIPPLSGIQKKWHVIYTRPHHEKSIFRELQRDNIEAYLPLLTTLKQWSDRKKKVTEPLFSCYMFVNVSLKEYYQVLYVPGVIRYITFEGTAAVLSEKKINTIKKLVENGYEPEELTQPMQIGQKVMITAGPLTGMDGELIFYSNRKRVIVRVDEINKCLSVNVPQHYLKLVG